METLSPTPAVQSAVPDVRLIPIDKIKPSSHQARKDFDEEGIAGLAESMRAEGLIQSVTVRESGDGFELISGERRLRAAKRLGWQTLEAKVIKTVSEAEAAAKGMAENLQRQDLNPIEEAQGFQEINQLDPVHWKQEQIARVSGRSQEYISLSLKLLGLPQEITQIIRARIISRSHGLELLRLKGDQQLQMAKRITTEHLNWEQTRKAVGEMKNNPEAAAPKEAKIPAGPDPLAALWPLMKENPDLKPTDWKPRYAGNGQWTLTVTLPSNAPGPDLARWLHQMESAVQDAIAHTDGRVTWDALIPKTRQELDQAVPDIKTLNIPSQGGAEDRLQQAGELLGPGEVIKEVFGGGSLYYRKVKDKTWEELGCRDPHEAVKKLVETLRKSAGG